MAMKKLTKGKRPAGPRGGRGGKGAGKGPGAGKKKRYLPKTGPIGVDRSGRGPAAAPKAGKAPARRAEKAPRRAPAPAKRVAPAAPQAPADTGRPTAFMIAKAALDKKAEDVTILDVRGLTSYADYFVVATADSDRQASAIADHVEQTMKAQGVSKVGVEGYETGRWILVDYGDVVAHVMSRDSRGFYDLEGLWADAPRIAVPA